MNAKTITELSLNDLQAVAGGVTIRAVESLNASTYVATAMAKPVSYSSPSLRAATISDPLAALAAVR